MSLAGGGTSKRTQGPRAESKVDGRAPRAEASVTFLSEAGEEADRSFDVAVGLEDQLLWIEMFDEKAAERLGIERPAPR